MFYLLHRKSGLGVEMWGTYDDLLKLYETIGKLWNDDTKYSIKGFENRDYLLSGFSYEIRKAYEDSKMQRKTSHFSFEPTKHFGTKFSWVHILFSFQSIRHNCKYFNINSLDLSILLQLEYWLEDAMKTYDSKGAMKLTGFINGGIFMGNEYLYQYMRSINSELFLHGGGKRTFRELPTLLKKAMFLSPEYEEYLKILEQDAVRFNASIEELEINDDNIDYSKL